MSSELGIKSQIIVLSADSYSVDNASGVTVFYVMANDFSPVTNSVESVGAKPGKANLGAEWFSKVNRAPAKYDATFVMKADSKGKMALTISDLNYLGDVKLADLSTK